MKKNVFVATALFAVLLSSCNSTDYSSEISQIDSLQSEVNGMEEKLKDFDGEAFSKYSRNAAEQLDWIKAKWPESDTMPRYVAAFLSDYKINKKSLSTFAKTLDKTREELIYSDDQLTKLKADLQNNLHTKEEAKKYLGEEKEAVETLTETSNKLVEDHDKYLNHYKGVNNRVDSLIDAMQHNGIR